MPYAQLCKKGVDCPDLDARSTASIANFGGSDMILSFWLKQRKCCKPFDDLGAGLRAREALQKLLQHKAGCDNHICAQESILELLNLRLRSRGVAPKRQRPNAGVYKESHVRDRSAL